MEEKKMARTVKAEPHHNVVMENRSKLCVSGVRDVESFNEEEILLHTELGGLLIKGSQLHINKLSVEIGEVALEGEIQGVDYVETKKNKGAGILSRMFR